MKQSDLPDDEQTGENKNQADQKDQAERFMSDYGETSSDFKRLLDPRRVLIILEYRRKIMDFVESMLDNEVSLESLKSGESLICQRDYDCIVQERYIQKLCGYPICSNKLTQTWNQKYHICLRTKKVYDVEVRKLYCSIRCLLKSEQYKKTNLNEQPIWMNIENIKLAPNFEKPKPSP